MMLLFLPIISALLLALSFERPFLNPLALIGLVPFFLFLERLNSDKSEVKGQKLKVFLAGWLAGWIFYALITRWFFATFPGEWVGIDNYYSALFFFITAWLGLAFAIASSFAVFGVSAGYFFKHLSLKAFKRFNFLSPETFKLFKLSLIVPSFWIISEYLRAWIFSLVLWGPEASLAPHWSFGNLGYTLIDTPLIFWSRFAGLYGVSFLVVLANVLIFLLLTRRLKLSVYKIAALIFAVSAIIILPGRMFSVSSAAKTLRVALVQINVSPVFFNASELSSLWEKARPADKTSIQPDIVVLPENSGVFSSIGDREKELLNRIFPDQDRPGLIITSFQRFYDPGGGRRIAQMVYRNQKGELIAFQEKFFLVPTGEFLPAVFKILIRLSGNQKIIDYFEKERAVEPAAFNEKPVAYSSTSVGALFCTASVSPLLYRELSRQGAELLINVISLRTFHEYPLVYPYLIYQLRTFARFQAVSNAKSFLQSANAGPVLAIDHNGSVAAEIEGRGNQVLFSDTVPAKELTFYAKTGDWPIGLAFLIVLVAAGFDWRKLRSERSRRDPPPFF